MPNSRKSLLPGQTSTAHIDALEKFLVEQLGETARYRQLPDAASMRHAKAKKTEPPSGVPRFTLVVDTAEQDYLFLVQRLRAMNIWAVARSMKRPPQTECAPNFYAGDFAVLEWQDVLGDDADEVDTEYEVPAGYRVLIDLERKTIPDLISSFADNRRERQRAEQENSSALRHIILIEGDINDLTDAQRCWVQRIQSDIDHLTFDSSFSVRQINTHSELLGRLKNMVRYAAQGIVDADAGITRYVKHSFAGKAQQRVVNTPEAQWSGVLQSVQGISPAAARAIIDDEFESFVEFARAAVEAADDPSKHARLIRRLSNVKVPAQSGAATREATRLGKRGERIVNMLIGMPRKRVAMQPAAAADDDLTSLSDDDDDDTPLVRTKSTTSDLWQSDEDV